MNNIMIICNIDLGEIRTITIDDTPWFMGRDICKMFGDKNASRSLSRVEDEDKKCIPITDALGRTQNAIFVNESGMYSLLFTMQPQKANHSSATDAYPIEVQERIDKLHKFKRWVTSEVLPSIRKHKMYAVDELIADPDRAIQMLTALKKKHEIE